MTLRAHQRLIRRLCAWWVSIHPDRALAMAIPAYAEATRHERRARARNDTKAIGRAVAAKTAALHANMRGAR